ncbi:MAG: pyridoxamine 5'-phosphate oxidase family protein [Candidatus Nanopelagicaceae bacterium]|nr:pyridoxamine 5'-phosphate oxidase family protein [Candidatus Nanopelagicaceae bacterium]
MGQVHERIDTKLREFIEVQHLYFVGTAPLAADGHINLSPKGHRDTFAVLDEHTVAYLDLTGSGAESLAHIRQNGRVVIMFCAFEGPPNIVRLHGQGTVHTQTDASFSELAGQFPSRPGARAVVTVDVLRVSSSCGFAVPFFDHVGDRDLLEKWAERKTDEELVNYRATKNKTSVDGLPALG